MVSFFFSSPLTSTTMRPSCIIIRRFPTRIASAILWVIIIVIRLSFSTISSIISKTFLAVLGSSAAVCSSRSRSFGFLSVANSSSKFANARGISVKDILNEQFILTEYGQGYRRVLDRELAKLSLEITPVLEIGRTDIITAMPEKSNMISFLPDFVTKELVDAGILCYLDISDIYIDIWKQLIYHKNKWISKSLKVFMSYVKEQEFTEYKNNG